LFGRLGEIVRYGLTRPKFHHDFYIVSCARHAGEDAVRCLASVHDQRYPRERIHHIYIDDASTDGTHERIAQWLREHPAHCVNYVHRDRRVGGTANNLDGFRRASPGAIVIELNGDDWLPDARTLDFLNRVYADPAVWMTYNTLRALDGSIPKPVPYPRSVVAANAFRRCLRYSSHLHSFRRELFDRVREDSLIDPRTGEYWASSDDLALYYPLLELAGRHARHLSRITYIYNYTAMAEERLDRSGQHDRARRIRELPPYSPLDALPLPAAAPDRQD
jgi:glycosyltransferase involved in cell wall biosynthesis